MYISKIELKNLRCFEDLSLEFGKGINVIVGKNNTGKSTIIKSIYQLQQQGYLNSNDIRKKTDWALNLVHLSECTSQDLKLFARIEEKSIGGDISKGRILCYHAIFKEGKGNNHERLFFPWDYSVHFDVHNGKPRIRNISKGNDEVGREFTHLKDSESDNGFIYPFLANRNVGYLRSSTSKDDIERTNEIFQYLPAKIQRLSNKSARTLNKKYESYCDKILGFVPGPVPENNNQSTVGCYSTPTEVISIGSMGDGVANILGLLTVLLTENNKLLLIEEIERDIHPEALKLLLELVIEKATENQIIISTHSHIVLKYLASVPSSKVFYIDSESYNSNDEYIPTSYIEEVENNPSARMKILRRLGYDMHDVDLFEGYLILEESSAEQVLREVLIPQFCPSLKTKLCTIAAGGVDDIAPRFNDFRRLFTFLHSAGDVYGEKVWVVADGDDAGNSVIIKMKSDFKSWKSNHFLNWEHSNFEQYYPDQFKVQVETALSAKDKRTKRELKAQLLKDVLTWSRENPQDSRNEFQKSAKEVLNFLKKIESRLS